MLTSTLFNNTPEQLSPKFSVNISKGIRKLTKLTTIQLNKSSGNLREYAKQLSTDRPTIFKFEKSFKARLDTCDFIGISECRKFVVGYSSNECLLFVYEFKKLKIEAIHACRMIHHDQWITDINQYSKAYSKCTNKLTRFESVVGKNKIINGLDSHVDKVQPDDVDAAISEAVHNTKLATQYEIETLQAEIASLKKQLEAAPEERKEKPVDSTRNNNESPTASCDDIEDILPDLSGLLELDDEELNNYSSKAKQHIDELPSKITSMSSNDCSGDDLFIKANYCKNIADQWHIDLEIQDYTDVNILLSAIKKIHGYIESEMNKRV